MKFREHRHVWALFALLAMHSAEGAPRRFPEVRLRPLTLDGVWNSAPMVVVGNLGNVRAVGTQKVENLPWPAPNTVKLIYWCRGDLRASAVVKGRAPSSGKEFLWGTAKSGCELFSKQQMQDTGPITRVWFIREEGNYVRPVVDGFGLYYIDLHAEWHDDPKVNPQIHFAELLLTPKARSTTLSEFAKGFFTLANTACSILGRERCIERIKVLGTLGEPELRKATCDFLESQFGEKCAL